MAVDDLQDVFKAGASVGFSVQAFRAFRTERFTGNDVRHAIGFGESKREGMLFICHGPTVLGDRILRVAASIDVYDGFANVIHVLEAAVYREA